MIRGQSKDDLQPRALIKEADYAQAWRCLPDDILQQVTCLLDVRSLKEARLVCKAWRQGISQAVKKLSPRIEANALGLQWSELHKIQEVFGTVRELDLRKMPPRALQAPFFARLTSVQRIYLSSLQRSAEPRALLSELTSFANALLVSNSATKIDLELRFGDSSLLWAGSSSNSHSSSDTDSDADIRAIAELPGNVEVTMLHMPQLFYAISAAGLASVMRLTTLRHLRLVTYGAHITDSDFKCLAGLTCLEHLWFGVLPDITDAGLLAGLGSLTRLRELFLYDVGGISDNGIEALSVRLASLEGLSLSKCHQLTNKGLESLARLPNLNRLFLSENEHITCAGADRFPDGLKSLTVRQCPNVNRSDIHV